MGHTENLKLGEIGAWLSIIAYIILSSLKLLIGNIAGSEALTADGLNNSTDIIASISVLIGLKISRKPPDHNHQYGHFRAETIAALLASFIIMAVGLHVLYDASLSAITPKEQSPDIIAAWTALFSACVMFGVFIFNFRLAKKIKSHAMMAAAQDNKSDALVSIGACIGIFGSKFGFAWIDTITAFIVGILICKTAWDIFKDSSLSLTDSFEDENLKDIENVIIQTPGVITLKDIKGRYHGSNPLIDVIIEVDPYISVLEGHIIADKIEDKLQKSMDINYVHIHVEPAENKLRKKR
ncbi:cation diffusion facilitator family transporter [Salinibacillus xinjiangensis]|uniref:Cation diffusion facilitator family transporter n=1 Tax=Salinibacillus xinjiangensis TaxID=1229268 RepID=A0A6G1X9B8_9BACI|nr:cation diffusion facilitator family transporter [Salinibacillus xinjiangensis]MRG87603.1 cation diffusion facilitator family transporter [Salinibacillus xinjiangensis]